MNYNCVGCGYCCMKSPCTASLRLYPASRICPQLIWSDKKRRYLCGLMTIQGLIGEGYRKELNAGAGCCCSLNSWRKDVKPRMTFDARSNMPTLDSEFQIFLNCLASEFVSSDSIILILSNMKNKLVSNLNYTDEEANTIVSLVAHYIEDNRHSFMKQFCG